MHDLLVSGEGSYLFWSLVQLTQTTEQGPIKRQVREQSQPMGSDNMAIIRSYKSLPHEHAHQMAQIDVVWEQI